jgi:hypothetical protein
VIDFRYHLVSLIAVFLAVALGIIIGTTALNEPILTDIKKQVSALEKDKRSLEDRTKQLQTQLNTSDAFDEAVAPALVGGALSGSRVLLVVTDDAVSQDIVDQVSTLVGTAGGTVSGTLTLKPAYTDPSTASSVKNYVTGPGLPGGLQLPPVDDAGQLVGSLLAEVLMIPPGGSGRDAAAISSVMAGLTALNVLTPEGASITPANYAIVLTAGAYSGPDAAARTTTVAELVTALDSTGSGAVVAGDTGSAANTGLVGLIRADTTLSAAVSTVDNVDSAAGRISTALALGRERAGTSGKYGTGQGTQPVPPVPAVTP